MTQEQLKKLFGMDFYDEEITVFSDSPYNRAQFIIARLLAVGDGLSHSDCMDSGVLNYVKSELQYYCAVIDAQVSSLNAQRNERSPGDAANDG